MATNAGHFKKGDDPRRSNAGGRPKKPEWLKGKGEEALRYAYGVMNDEDQKTELRMQAARMLVEYDIGKPLQQMQVEADLGDDTRKALTERMTLDDAKAIIEQFRG